MPKNDMIHVLVSTDDNGCSLLAPLIISLGETTTSRIHLHVFQKDLKPENKEKLTQTAATAQIKIEFVEMKANFDFYVPKHWPLPALFRLTADSVLSSLDKVIYLDIDTLVYKDIRPLWDTDLGDHYFGACWGMDIHRDLGVLDPEKKVKEYFNSGVLLMNLKKMRKDSIGKKCLQFMEKHKDELHAIDQDALNVVCAGKIKPLPICWNWYISLERRKKSKLKKIFRHCLSQEPAIIHFYSQYKPNRLFVYPRHLLATYRIWKRERFYWHVLAKTPYRVKREIKIKW